MMSFSVIDLAKIRQAEFLEQAEHLRQARLAADHGRGRSGALPRLAVPGAFAALGFRLSAMRRRRGLTKPAEVAPA